MAKPRTPVGRAKETAVRLAEDFPGTTYDLCELRHENPFQLLAATILSAQCTDKKVNEVTPALFARYPDPHSMAGASEPEMHDLIRQTGFYQNKTRSLLGMSAALVERHGAEVPTAMEDLVQLPGVGRKTANVIRSVAFDLPGLPVDTHVLRVTDRLGMRVATAHSTDAVKVEHELNELIPAAARGVFSLRVILHGRRVCDAKKPACEVCSLADFCPSNRLAPPKRR